MCAVTEQTSDLAGRWEALLRKERLALGHVQASPAGQAGSLITNHFKIVTTLKETGRKEQAITRGKRKPAATNRPPSSRNSSASFFLPTYCGKALKRHFFSSMGKIDLYFQYRAATLSVRRTLPLFPLPASARRRRRRRQNGKALTVALAFRRASAPTSLFVSAIFIDRYGVLRSFLLVVPCISCQTQKRTYVKRKEKAGDGPWTGLRKRFREESIGSFASPRLRRNKIVILQWGWRTGEASGTEARRA